MPLFLPTYRCENILNGNRILQNVFVEIFRSDPLFKSLARYFLLSDRSIHRYFCYLIDLFTDIFKMGTKSIKILILPILYLHVFILHLLLFWCVYKMTSVSIHTTIFVDRWYRCASPFDDNSPFGVKEPFKRLSQVLHWQPMFASPKKSLP